MVQLHVTQGSREFVFETKTNAQVQDVIISLSELNNKILQIRRLADAVSELAKFGPSRKEEHRSLTRETIDLSNDAPNDSANEAASALSLLSMASGSASQSIDAAEVTTKSAQPADWRTGKSDDSDPSGQRMGTRFGTE